MLSDSRADNFIQLFELGASAGPKLPADILEYLTRHKIERGKKNELRPRIPQASWVFRRMQMDLQLSYHSQFKATHRRFPTPEVSGALSRG